MHYGVMLKMTPPNVKDLISQIFDAFGGVKLDGGVSLIEADYADGGQIAPLNLINLEEQDDWTKVIDDRLCDFPGTFCFTDYKGFRFYIAPYMIWSLRNYVHSDSIISDHTVYNIDPDSHIFEDKSFEEVFSFEQIKCMRDFLLFAYSQYDYFDSKIAGRRVKRLQKRFSKLFA